MKLLVLSQESECNDCISWRTKLSLWTRKGSKEKKLERSEQVQAEKEEEEEEEDQQVKQEEKQYSAKK